MGDIDDFFAKKDKKKKGAKKFSKANTDVIAKNLIETDKKELKEQERQDKELGSQLSEEKVTATTANNDDEEWDDYRENKKDYTGLKIDTLTIEDQEPEEEEEETEINEDGEVVKVKKDDSGPWNKGGASVNVEAQQELIQEPEPASIQTPNVVKGSYVPPHMRGSSESTVRAMERKPLPRGGGRNKTAPDLNSEVYFPSLSSAAEDTGPKGAWGKKSAKRTEYDGGHFEEVKDRGSSSQAYARQNEAPRLALGNKFDALRD